LSRKVGRIYISFIRKPGGRSGTALWIMYKKAAVNFTDIPLFFLPDARIIHFYLTGMG